MPAQASTIDADEMARFRAIAADWWNPEGRFGPLHRLNPCRLDYIIDQVAAEFDRDPRGEAPLAGLRLLDLGCGGGLLAEPMARLGAEVVGADPQAETIPVARLHAEQSGLDIDYRETTAEALAAAGERFDVILNMEVVEHVPDPLAYLGHCAALLRPGGLMVTSTINRTAKSFALAIVGAEYALGWLPRGTHTFSKLITPDELAAFLRRAGLAPVDRKGLVYNPARKDWRLSEHDLAVNYVCTSLRPT